MMNRMESDTPEVISNNIAIVGCGYWGQNLIRNFAALGALHTICDSNPETLNRLKQSYPTVNKETCYEEVLASEETFEVIDE